MISDNKKKMFQGVVGDIMSTRKDLAVNAIRKLLNDSDKPKLARQYDCYCYNCNKDRMENGFPWVLSRMIVCPECGNKRCPKATDHHNKCTGSNDAGQKGSRY